MRKTRDLEDDTLQIKDAFKLYADNRGRVNISELKSDMESINLDQTHPKIFKVIQELDNSENRNGLNFDSFMSQVNDKLGDLVSRDGIKKVFDQFLENPRDSTITLSSLRNVTRDLGETVNSEELKDILSKSSKNGTELTFEEFYSIMMKMA